MLSLVFAYLERLFGIDRIQSQATMEVREEDRVLNRPEPDIAALWESVTQGAPTGSDVLLAVEISDTTQADDFGRKVSLYARAGVAEYWVLDLERRVLVAFRRPENDGWLVRDEYAETDCVAPQSEPENTIAVADLLPPSSNS